MDKNKMVCSPKTADVRMMTDSMLTELFRSDPEQALSELARRYGGYCFQIIFRILNCREDAEECVNDVLLQAWKTLQARQPECLRAYLSVTARNRAITYYRKEHAEKRGGSILMIPVYNGFPEQKQSLEDDFCGRILIRQCLETLLSQYSHVDREMFLQRYEEMQSISALAENFSLSESCVRSRLFRMRGRLRRKLVQCGIACL